MIKREKGFLSYGLIPIILHCAECHQRVERAIEFTDVADDSLLICEGCLERALEFLREGSVTIRKTQSLGDNAQNPKPGGYKILYECMSAWEAFQDCPCEVCQEYRKTGRFAAELRR